ncbi:MAG: lytic murein transglycosylase [Marmoricola sp.]
MRGITGRTTRTIVLLAALMVLPGQQSLHLLPRPAVLSDSPVAPATVTTPGPDDPVSVSPATGSYVGGVANAAEPVGDHAGKALPSDVLAAYTLAIAVAPPGCHLTLPLLAAIGQVESGNLAGHTVDAKNRVTPAIIGPVLNGKGRVRAVADTDGGQWDGNKRWDRALGPFQFIPSSWRVAGVDMDADGVRDPQNIYDAAGAAMVYLCAGGRDLATAAGLRQGVLSYNHSASYLELVLAWKAVLENVDLNGVTESTVYGAWALPTTQTATPADLSVGAGTPRHTSRRTVTHSTAATKPAPTRSAAPSTSAPSDEPDPAPSAGPTTPATPTETPTPTPSAPTQGPTKDPDPTTPAEPLPPCPVPTDDPTASPAPATQPTPVEPAPANTPEGWVAVIDPTDPDAVCVVPVDPDDPTGQAPAPSPAP